MRGGTSCGPRVVIPRHRMLLATALLSAQLALGAAQQQAALDPTGMLMMPQFSTDTIGFTIAVVAGAVGRGPLSLWVWRWPTRQVSSCIYYRYAFELSESWDSMYP